jgi:dihydroorotase-like cyclic amidohydrolase
VKTIVRGGRIVTSSLSFEGDILIEGETIAALGSFPEVQAGSTRTRTSTPP